MSSGRLCILDSPLLYAAASFPSPAFPVLSGPRRGRGRRREDGRAIKNQWCGREEGQEEEGRSGESDHAEESGSESEGCRSAGRVEEEEGCRPGIRLPQGNREKRGAAHGGGECRGRRKEEEAFRCCAASRRLKPKIKTARLLRPAPRPRRRGQQRVEEVPPTQQGPRGWGSAPPTWWGGQPAAAAAPAPLSVQMSRRLQAAVSFNFARFPNLEVELSAISFKTDIQPPEWLMQRCDDLAFPFFFSFK